MVDIIRVRNPAAFLIPEIELLIDDAFANVTCDAARNALPESIREDHVALYLARIDDEWKGLAWVRLSTRDDDKSATVLHFYCRKAGRGVREALVKAVVDFAKAGGMETLMAWDINKKPRAFQKLFRSAGPSKEVVRAYEFDLKGATTDETDHPTCAARPRQRPVWGERERVASDFHAERPDSLGVHGAAR